MMINWVNGGLVIGAALAALPILFHLFLRQKPRHFIFPALRLLQQRHRTNVRRLRLRHLLLLLLRMLAIALMALALARPVLHSTGFIRDQKAPVAAALVFDTNLTMQYKAQGQTRLEAAQALAQGLLKHLPDYSEVAVIDSAEPVGTFGIDTAEAVQRIKVLKIRPLNHPLDDAIIEAYQTVARSSKVRKEVYVFTNLVRHDWDLTRAAQIQKARAQSKEALTYVIAPPIDKPQDFAVVDLVPSEQVVSQTSELVLTARVQATGPGGDKVVEFDLDQGRRRDAKPVHLAENGEAVVEFAAGVLPPGVHQGRVTILGSDPMAFDDTRYVTVETRPVSRVAIFSDRARDAAYWAEALAPEELRRQHRARYEVVEHRTPAGLTAEALEGCDVACLINVAELPGRAWDDLRSYVVAGNGLLVAPGSRTQVASYNSPAAQAVLPARIKRILRRLKDPTYLNPQNFNHPVLQKFKSFESRDWRMLPISRYVEVTDRAKTTRDVLDYLNGQPALLERDLDGVRTGRVLMLTTALTYQPDPKSPEHWNELPVGWSFVVLADQVSQYLAGRTAENLNYTVGERASLRLGAHHRFNEYLEYVPGAEQPTRLNPEPGETTLDIPSLTELGQYRVVAGGEDKKFQAGFSVNPPRSASQLKLVGSEDLENLFGKGNFAVARDMESLKTKQTDMRIGHEIFPWMMSLVLLVVVAENLLANRFYQHPEPRGKGSGGE